MNAWWLLVPLSYVLGSFPTAKLVGLLTGNDPHREGSGNPGASNMYRVAGRRAGMAVLIGDVFKGLVPAAIGLVAAGRPLGVACGVAAMLGHVVPATRQFRGGKGVATLGGACCVLYPVVSLALIVSWAAAVSILRTASVGSLIMAFLLPVGVAMTGRPNWEVAIMGVAALVIVVRHWRNIVRLLNHEERVLPR